MICFISTSYVICLRLGALPGCAGICRVVSDGFCLNSLVSNAIVAVSKILGC